MSNGEISVQHKITYELSHRQRLFKKATVNCEQTCREIHSSAEDLSN